MVEVQRADGDRQTQKGERETGWIEGQGQHDECSHEKASSAAMPITAVGPDANHIAPRLNRLALNADAVYPGQRSKNMRVELLLLYLCNLANP